MKKQSLKTGQCMQICLAFLLFLLPAFGNLQAQSSCEGAPNPPNPPMCQPPGGDPFKVLLVLDESGSITPASELQVEDAVLKFAKKLEMLTPSLGRMQLGIVDFNSNAFNPVVLTDVKAPGFITTIENYLNTNYNPTGGTVYEKAFIEAKNIATNALASTTGNLDIIFFITDGDSNDPTANWQDDSDAIKNMGTYIFGIAIGASPVLCKIKILSGPHELDVDASFSGGADWTRTNFELLAGELDAFAKSLIDITAPDLDCPGPIKVPNEPGVCGSKVLFDAAADDECAVASSGCVPPSGSFFPVGQTVVNCKAKDNAGNESTCSFKVTVLDLEAPKIACPPNKTISCEENTAPSNTGNPVTSDNCGVGSVAHVDVKVNGSCENEFTLNRTWTVADVHGNVKDCVQTISVEDKKPPVINCPANATVTCDISVAKTGSANATDNCDMSVDITHSDIHISGDCEWFCITERHWKATDNCGNTSKCVQVVTKDVTPLIEQALGSGPLVWGQTAATVTLPPGKGACVVKWLPYVGVVPTALKFDDAVADADCKLMSNPLDRNTGQIVNPLLGEAMKLKILVRLNPALGLRKLKTNLNCDMHFIVRQALAGGEDATVNELLRVTDLTLGNVNVNLLVPAHCLELLKVLQCVNAGRTVCNNP